MIIAVMIVLGLCLGSFVNALVWRIHAQAQTKNKKTKKKLSVTKGRSMCPHCKHELAAKDLVPLLSWLSLRGKCRYCKSPIGWQYPVVELTTAALFVLSYLCWPLEWNLNGTVGFMVWLVMLTGFMALLVYDLKWMLLPNRIIYPLIIVALLYAAFNIVEQASLDVLYQTCFGVLIAGGIFFALFQLSSGRWIGGGDVKLGTLIGLLLGDAYLSFLMLFTASALGTLVILPGMLTGRVKPTSRIPFGPFLIIAAILVRLFGMSVVEWYRRSLRAGI